MDADLLALILARNDGVVSARELDRAGFDGHAVRGCLRRHELVRVRSGAFVGGQDWSAADVTRRHVLATRAMVRRLDGYAASHVSAVALWDLPVLAQDLGLVHVCHVGSGPSRSAGRLRVHRAVRSDAVVQRYGVCVVRAELAVIQTTALSVRAGLIAADAALRSGLNRELLHAAAVRLGSGQGVSRVLALASDRSESPGESLTRLVLDGLGVEAEQQAEIRDERVGPSPGSTSS